MKTQALKGMVDILPLDNELRRYIKETILAVYRDSGFLQIDTPILEDIENILHSDGGDNLSLTFKVLKRGDKLAAALAASSTVINPDTLSDMALRYDLTLPLSRFYAANSAFLPFPFKVIQIGRVYRAERPQKGRLREFTQCDIDILGDKSINSEIELIDITALALEKLGFSSFMVKINDRALLHSLLLSIGFREEEIPSVCITYDKIAKIGIQGVKEELVNKGFSSAAIEALTAFITTNNGGEEGLNKVKGILGTEATEEIEKVINAINKIKTCQNSHYSIEYSPSLIRGQGYYTGIIFEITLEEGNISIAGGGRYDKMIGSFTGKETPAAGFSIGFERVYSILKEKKFTPPASKSLLAVLYDKDADFSTLLQERRKLEDKYYISLYPKQKNAGSQYKTLEKAGYTAFATFRENKIVIKE